MSRTLHATCEQCGVEQPLRPNPPTWWLLEDHGLVARTGPLDFCTLRCLLAWLVHPDVQRAYERDFTPALAAESEKG